MGWCKLKRDDDPFGPPRHHLSLPPAGRVRRAPHDVPAARQLRPAADRGEARDRRRSRRRSAGSTTSFGNCVALAELRRRRRASCASRAAIRLDHAAGRARPTSRSRSTRATYPFCLRAPRRCRTSLPSIERHYPDPDRRGRPLGAAVRAPTGGRPTTGELLMTLTYAIKRRLRLRAARPERGTQPPLLTLRSAAAAAAISRC